MLFHRKLENALLICVFGFLCVSCAAERHGGPYDHSTDTSGSTSLEHRGMSYLTGQGVLENHQQAAYWLEKAAKGGSAKAANVLAYLYASGDGVTQNYALALQWYQQAARAGIASAKYNLGLMYAYGLGVPVDQTTALDYFNQAAALGFRPAHKKSTG